MWGRGRGTQDTTPVSIWEPEKGTAWEENQMWKGMRR